MLSPSDFFVQLRRRVKLRLPPDLRGFQTSRGRGRLMKLHYGEPAFHFEAWHHTGAGRLEIGLHFEASGAQNQEAFDFFRSRIVEVKAGLPRAELEPWDRGWRRIYETAAAPQLDGAVLDDAVGRLADYVITLEPLLEQFLRSHHEET